MCSFSFSPVLYQAKFPIAFHTLLSQTSQTCRFQGVGPRWAKLVSSSDSQDPVMFTEAYLHRRLNFFEALSRSFTPLSPLVQLSGTPPLVAERGFSPKGGSSPEQKGPTEKWMSPVVLSVVQIPQGTDGGTVNFFLWTNSSQKGKHWKILTRVKSYDTLLEDAYTKVEAGIKSIMRARFLQYWMISLRLRRT